MYIRLLDLTLGLTDDLRTFHELPSSDYRPSALLMAA